MPLYLIRHGKPAAAWGDDDDPGLDETGRAQAKAVAETLMALPESKRPRSVVSSPLRRCRETTIIPQGPEHPLPFDSHPFWL